MKSQPRNSFNVERFTFYFLASISSYLIDPMITKIHAAAAALRFCSQLSKLTPLRA